MSPLPLAQVLARTQLIFPSQNLVFWNLFWIFSGKIHLKISISHILNPNLYQINFIKILLIKIFPTTPKAHNTNSSENSQLWINLICSEEIIQYSRTFAPQVWSKRHGTVHAPFLVESFPKTSRTWSEASRFSGSHNYQTKQNKQPSFIDRLFKVDSKNLE